MTRDEPYGFDERRGVDGCAEDGLIRALRAASSPRLATGAAERIAEGAWRRGALLRDARAPRRLGFRRAAWAAAAAVLVGASFLALRGTEPVFAVEGDPVMIQRGDRWEEAWEVPVECDVRVPEGGTREVRSRQGGVVRPLPGSEFRFVPQRGPLHAFRVEFRAGGGDVQGPDLVVAMPGDVVVERDPASPILCVSITLDAADGSPLIENCRGDAYVRHRKSQQRVRLAPAEKVAYLSVPEQGAQARRFVKVKSWSPDAAERMFSGRIELFDARPARKGGLMFLGSAQDMAVLAFEVPLEALPEAVGTVNWISRARTLTPAWPAARYEHEKDGRRVVVTVAPTGAVRVDGAGAPRTFTNLSELRRDAPEIVQLFGDGVLGEADGAIPTRTSTPDRSAPDAQSDRPDRR